MMLPARHGGISIEYLLLATRNFDLTKFYPIDSSNTILLYKHNELIVASLYDTIIGDEKYDSISQNILFQMRGDFQDTVQYWNNGIVTENALNRLANKNKTFVIYNGLFVKELKIKYYSTKNEYSGLSRWYYNGVLLYEYVYNHS